MMLSLNSTLAIAILLALPSVSAAQEAGGAQPDQDLLVFHCTGAQGSLTHPKDEGLRRALGMVAARLMEVPGELGPEQEMPPELMPLLTQLFGGPLSVRVGVSGTPIAGMPVPLYLSIRSHEASPGAAAELAGHVRGMLAAHGVDQTAADASGLVPLPIPVPAWYGTRENDFVVCVGRTDVPPADPAPYAKGLPEGVAANTVLYLDYGGLIRTVLAMAETFGGEDLSEVRAQMDAFGVDQLKLSWASGSDGEKGYQVTRMPGYAQTLRNMGMMPERALGMQSLRLVPQDATWAVVSKVDFGGTLDFLKQTSAASTDEAGGWPLIDEGDGEAQPAGSDTDPFAAFEAMTGIDLEADLIAHLGSTWGMYASDTSGGGGMLSTVMFLELADPDSVVETRDRLAEIVNGMARSQARGYVELRQWEDGDARYSSLVFPGLPIPFQPTSAIAGNHVFVGISPQAAMAAVHQADHGGEGLLGNPSFQAQLPGGTDGLYSVGFLDTPRLLADGYGLASLLTAALVNGTRSPSDRTRDAGAILPPYHVLAQGAKATVQATRVEGADFVTHAHSDASALVNLTGLLGVIGPGMALLAPAVALPAMKAQPGRVRVYDVK